eukprot:g5046.t1
MALRRVLSKSRNLPTVFHRVCSTNAVPSETEIDQKETEEVQEKQEKESMKSYKTNSILPHCAFLFPGRVRPLEKKLHLRSLRRANFSSAVSSALNVDEREEVRKCLWCQTEAKSEDKFFCQYCQRVLPVNESIDFFTIFNMSPTFEVQISELENTYRKHQMLLHPDKFASKDHKEQDLASKHAMRINKAYQKLKNPLDRAKYLLKLRGFVFDRDQTISDPEFLSEMMELQETVVEMKEKEELQALLDQVDIRRQGLLNSVSNAFTLNDLSMASELVTELSYLERVREQIRDKM